MISRQRMKIDLWTQMILALIAIALTLWKKNDAGLVGWILLFAWQMLSAFLLYVQFRYQQRKSFIWIGLLGIVLLFINSSWFLLFLSVYSLGYFSYTLSDTIKVFRRPRSFWELS